MARPRKQVYTMEQYTKNVSEGYITNDADTQRNPAWKPIVDGLAVTILTDEYIPPIILAEEESGIYHLTENGGRNLINFWKEVRKPAEVMMIEKLIAMKDNLLSHIEKQKLDGIRVPLTDIGGNRGYKPVYKELAYVIDGKKDGKDWTKCKNMGGYEKPEGSALPLSVKFASATEAQNFYDVFYTKFGSWICDITHTQQHLQPSILPWLDDYSHPWTDEMLYEYFGLSPEEISIIENSISA